ncbi:hypothetical protein [Micromonospora sp. NPDC004704]
MVCSLVPYLVLAVAVLSLGEIISTSLAISRPTLQVTASVSAGAYAVGTLLAVQFAMHLPPRRMLITYEICFVVASVLAATAPNAPVFIGAFIAQGLLTSLMLIAALPPLVTAWPASKMPITAGILNLCIFGALGLVGATALYLSGRPRLETPDLERFQGRGEPAWSSPPILSAVHRKWR